MLSELHFNYTTRYSTDSCYKGVISKFGSSKFSCSNNDSLNELSILHFSDSDCQIPTSSTSFDESHCFDMGLYSKTFDCGTNMADVTPTSQPSFSPTQVPTASSRIEEVVAISVSAPLVLVLAAVIYMLVTNRNRKGEKKNNNDLKAVQDKFPKSKVSRKKTLGFPLGISLSVVKVESSLYGIRPDHSRKESDDDVSKKLVFKESEISKGKIIGKGGHGTVYEGLLYGSPVALKEFTGSRSDSVFKREVSILKKLHHPNIIRYLGSFQAGTTYTLVLERASTNLRGFITGKRIRNHPIFQQGVPLSTLIEWCFQICSALSYLHSKKFVHMDIKPENILFDNSWNVKLCDLGTSRSFKSIGRAASGGEGGSPQYVAPEILQDDRDAIGPHTDVYAFGIVLWEMFHQRDPYPSSLSTTKVLEHCVNGDRPPIDPNLPFELSSIIAQCWHKKASKRCSSDELVKAFGNRSQAPGSTIHVWDHQSMVFYPGTATLVDGNETEARIKWNDGTRDSALVENIW